MDIMMHSVISTLKKQKQEDSLGYLIRSCLKHQQKERREGRREKERVGEKERKEGRVV